jgi:hypothetical protein
MVGRRIIALGIGLILAALVLVVFVMPALRRAPLPEQLAALDGVTARPRRAHRRAE